MKIVVLWLVAAVAVWVVGCATGKDEKAEGATGGKQYTIRKLVLPEQKAGPFPFSVRKTKYLERFTERDLVPAVTVMPYMKALAKAGKIPFLAKEGLLWKENKSWYLTERLGKVYTYNPPCVGYYRCYIADFGVD